ncbi:uncharacterized protein LOC121736458 [Aricia agestis]|uniref:uncharacterized protein LOC121736458 n=1 Tax=Aricia agestis TaxID=91739 RepID=UPI001C209BB4|nr:uncharacterized protein LOC121736458 [Aricia agestis]XP_041983591.1 uncharacterized protein LOC121736458 [Aricia agestis]XP_041983592.1 uncharacterized protein LOC121736458 [Aricia agestis]
MYRIIMAVVVWVCAQAQWSPDRFPSVWEREAWQEREMELLIKNMTLELLDDVTQKLTMADKVREIHQKSITFELGAIAAGVMERYWQMIHIYKTYADLQTFTANTYYTRTMYDKYASILACVLVTPKRFDTALVLEGVSDDVIMSLNDTTAKNLTVEELRNSARESTLGLQLEGVPDYRRRFGWRRDRIRSCYSISSINLGAVYDLRDYFQMRILYSNTLEYEVGYLTHEIIYKYGLILEMYKLVTDKMAGELEKTPEAPNMFVFHIYTYILEHGRAIAVLCDMLRVLEDKYRRTKKKGIFENDEIFEREQALKEAKYNHSSPQATAHEEYLKRWRRERKRLIRLERQRNKAFATFRPYSSTRRTTPKRGPWPLIYGWSIEDW